MYVATQYCNICVSSLPAPSDLPACRRLDPALAPAFAMRRRHRRDVASVGDASPHRRPLHAAVTYGISSNFSLQLREDAGAHLEYSRLDLVCRVRLRVESACAVAGLSEVSLFAFGRDRGRSPPRCRFALDERCSASENTSTA